MLGPSHIYVLWNRGKNQCWVGIESRFGYQLGIESRFGYQLDIETRFGYHHLLVLEAD